MCLSSPSCFTVTVRITLSWILKRPFEGATSDYLQKEINGRKEIVKSENIFFTQKAPQACLKPNKEVIQLYLSLMQQAGILFRKGQGLGLPRCVWLD